MWSYAGHFFSRKASIMLRGGKKKRGIPQEVYSYDMKIFMKSKFIRQQYEEH